MRMCWNHIKKWQMVAHRTSSSVCVRMCVSKIRYAMHSISLQKGNKQTNNQTNKYPQSNVYATEEEKHVNGRMEIKWKKFKLHI